MSRSWIGSIISADCGDSLGTYQGQVKSVDDGAQTLTLAGPFRNGLKCEVKELTLCAGDIRYLKILMSPYDASNVLSKRTTPSKLTKEITEEAVVIGCVSPRSVVSQGQGDRHHSNHHTQNGRSPVTLLSSGGYMVSPVKHRPDNNNSPHYGYTNGLTNGNHANRNHRYTPPNDEACNYRPRRNSNDNMASQPLSASDVKKKSSTPRKIDFKQRPTPREDCFSAPTDSYLDEFDFEKNLALFDKKAVFEEIENSSHPMVICANKDKRTAKYRCDENVLQSGPVVLQQIKVPSSETKSYVTDSGLLVPCITPEMRAKLMVAADGVGLNESRLIEMLGRSASEMVLQLLGGSHRMSPQNNHQRPVVVVLCGDHKQGAQGVNSARHLANHNVQTEVFVPSRQPRHKVLEQELNLYQLTGSKVTSDIKDLPVGTVDMVISAVDCHDAASGLLEEDWYQSLVKWVPVKRAPVLSVDPPTRGTPFQSKWSLGVGLPLALPSSCGQVYLSDLSLPKKVFSDIGIKYLSPFGHKFVIPLHAKS